MANIVIVTDTNLVKVVFNDESSKVGMDKGSWRKDKFLRIVLNSDHVEVQTQDDHRWMCVYNSSTKFLVVDSIDAVSLTSNSDLYDKLVAML